MRMARYLIMSIDNDQVTLADLGPWERFPTITNSIEEVLLDLKSKALLRPSVYYYDSENEKTEALHVSGVFKGFA